MDLTEYERVKFELAAILRSATVAQREKRPGGHNPFSDLFARLAEDRFNLMVVGRFSRGKTSLMNAMLDTDRLPTGILPLTSVITTVSYGSSERAFIEHEGWSLPHEIPLDALPDYVTQQGNPGNARRVALARIELSSELLRRGFHLVDTPGLGSSIMANTRTTESFLPQADAFMLVTSYDSPLSEEELQILQRVASTASRVFLVVNKQDTVSLEERKQVIGHLGDQARRVFGDPPHLFSVSAREAMEANRLNDGKRLAASGVPALKDELIRFLLNEKQAEFLLRMCERIAEVLNDVPVAGEESERLLSLHREIARQRPNGVPPTPVIHPTLNDNGARFSLCWVCARIDRKFYDLLCKFQYEVSADRKMQVGLADHGGLCPFHSWQYEMVASPRGTCIGFSSLLQRLAERLRKIAASSPENGYARELQKLNVTAESCGLCQARAEIERDAIVQLAGALRDAERKGKHRSTGLCVPHLELVAETIGPGETTRRLIAEEAVATERLSEDMRRYAVKHDGMRRFLASSEEVGADQRALMLLAGHPNVNGPWKRR
jgi:GTP-binding protein EngB required for normal cell division